MSVDELSGSEAGRVAVFTIFFFTSWLDHAEEEKPQAAPAAKSKAAKAKATVKGVKKDGKTAVAKTKSASSKSLAKKPAAAAATLAVEGRSLRFEVTDVFDF